MEHNEEYYKLDPKAQEIVDFFVEHYDDPAQVIRNMIDYIKKYQ
jgi:hypothetical protein